MGKKAKKGLDEFVLKALRRDIKNKTVLIERTGI